MKILLSVLLSLLYMLPAEAQTNTDKIDLDRAKEYFAAGKYHESLIEFMKLDKEYNLSRHYYAYMALCFYKENEYDSACIYYAKAAPYLAVCAPNERSLYLYTLADSHFKLGRYSEARSSFEKALDVCSNKEKADIYYHIGFCQYFTGEKNGALHSFRMSLKDYSRYMHETGTEARITQLKKMISGLENDNHDNINHNEGK